jgi:hypothetical protein
MPNKPAFEQPDSWCAFTKPRSARDPELNLDARAQAFLKRIAPLSTDLAAHGRTRALASQETPQNLPSPKSVILKPITPRLPSSGSDNRRGLASDTPEAIALPHRPPTNLPR